MKVSTVHMLKQRKEHFAEVVDQHVKIIVIENNENDLTVNNIARKLQQVKNRLPPNIVQVLCMNNIWLDKC